MQFQKRFLRIIFGWLVIAALAAHGFIPVGYMPNFDHASGQTFALTICTGGAHHNQKDGDQKSHDQSACPYSVNSVFAASLDLPLLTAPIVVFAAMMVMSAFVLAAIRRFGNAGARAPPLYS